MPANANIPVGAPEDPQTLISATFCLMSCVMQSGSAYYLPTIADKLDTLANDPRVDASFRRVCLRLCQHWESCLNHNQSALPEGDSATFGSTQREPCQ